MTGTVYLVGAGPGAPDLLTLRAARLLERADVVLYDALVHPDTVALAAKARLVPVGKRNGVLSADQRFINRALVEAGRQNAVVVRLKGGDPMLFGRAREEMEALDRAGIPYEVVPGVTSALAAAADLATPLTERGVSRSVTFATPRVGTGLAAGDWCTPVVESDTSMLYMASTQAREVAAELVARGMSADTPVAVVENASLPNMHTLRATLGRLSSEGLPALAGPALVCIGAVFADRSAGGAVQTPTAAAHG